MDNQNYLTTKQVAEKYNISAGTLEVWRQLTKNGTPRGPKWITLEGSIRYHIDDLSAWEASQNTSEVR